MSEKYVLFIQIPAIRNREKNTNKMNKNTINIPKKVYCLYLHIVKLLL